MVIAVAAATAAVKRVLLMSSPARTVRSSVIRLSPVRAGVTALKV